MFLEINNLKKSFGTGESRVEVLKGTQKPDNTALRPKPQRRPARPAGTRRTAAPPPTHPESDP